MSRFLSRQSLHSMSDFNILNLNVLIRKLGGTLVTYMVCYMFLNLIKSNMQGALPTKVSALLVIGRFHGQ